MSKRTSSSTRTLTVVAAPGSNGKVTFKEGSDLDYLFNEANGIFQHDANQLYDTLAYLLPKPTLATLRKRMGEVQA